MILETTTNATMADVAEYEIQHFEHRENGHKAYVTVTNDRSVIENIKKNVRRSFIGMSHQTDEDIVICCYEFGKTNRINLVSDEQFRELQPNLKSRVIYFYSANSSAPPSPDGQRVAQLEKRLDELEVEVMLLKSKSCC